MHSSFRASKLILSKVGTAASFGIGLNAGVRYADSQSGHRFALEEARTLSRPHTVDFDLLEREGERQGERQGGGGDSSLVDAALDLDVDRSDLLFGYSTSCFGSGCGMRGSSAATLSAAVSQLSACSLTGSSSSSSSPPSSSPPSSSSGPIPTHRENREETKADTYTEGDRGTQVKKGRGSRHREDRSYFLGDQHQHRGGVFRGHADTGPDSDAGSDAGHAKSATKHLYHHHHLHHQTQTQAHSHSHRQSNQTSLYPPAGLKEGGKVMGEERSDELTWDSLLDKHTCTICSDLLAGTEGQRRARRRM